QPNPALARYYGVTGGVIIGEVTPGKPAEKAGLQIGDTITAINGKPVKSGDELVNLISATKPGGKITVSYIRDGKSKDTTVSVTDRADLLSNGRDNDAEENASAGEPPSSKLGMSVHALNQEQAERLGIPERKGVLITEVQPDSFAEDVGLQPRMVVFQINRQPVNSEDDFRKIVNKLKSGDDVVFLVRQGRGSNAGTSLIAGTLP
ncbi:MAG TPA: PDZ domain-containing protein, partial [Alphaproteobacteria bacterium]|nr:PDZ domain-containing protein [Alphaproteobacteria bacterium]